MDLGLACHVCGTLNALGAQTCSRCGAVVAPPLHEVHGTGGATGRTPPDPGFAAGAAAGDGSAAVIAPSTSPRSVAPGSPHRSGTYPGSGTPHDRPAGDPFRDTTLPGNATDGGTVVAG